MTAVVGVVGCANLNGMPETGRAVREVTVKGNKAVKKRELVEGLINHPPEGLFQIKRATLDEGVLEDDKERIKSFYQRLGYYGAKVVGVVVRPVRELHADVNFVVEEGEPTRVSSMAIGGVPAEPADAEEQLFELMELKTGDIFVHNDYLTSKEQVEKQLAKWGYAHAQVTGQVEVDRQERTATVRLRADAGERVYWEKTKVAGLGYMPEELIRRRIAWDVGDLYSPADVDYTRSEIARLKRFSTINIQHDEDTGDASITLSEALRNEVRGGVGLGVDPNKFEARAQLTYTRYGVFSPLNSLTMTGRPAYAFQPFFVESESTIQGFTGEASVQFERIDFPVPLATTELLGGYFIEEIDAYSTRGPRGRLSIGRAFLRRRLKASMGWQLDLLDFFASSDLLNDAERMTLGIGSATRVGHYFERISFDSRANPLKSTTGVYVELAAEQGTVAAGSEFDYFKITPELRGYLRVLPSLLFALRGKLGLALNSDVLPITVRYYSGGASNHRGFPARGLGPIAVGDPAGTVVLGGKALLETSFEARVEEIRKTPWGFVLFVDAADATNELAELARNNLHWATGFGLRYDTPIGPARADLGFRLNRLDAGEPRPNKRVAFHLSIGATF